MPVRVKKPHPAIKHGGYSATSILPGEDAAEFHKLHRDLIAELAPNGALEDEIVATIARLLWRKRNFETFRIAELARSRRNRIFYEILPEAKPNYPFSEFEPSKKVDPAKRAAALQAADDQARKELGEAYELTEIDDAATVERLLKDLEVQDRFGRNDR